MRQFLSLIILFAFTTLGYAKSGEYVKYQVNDALYEGYYVPGKKNAPFVLLVHDWNGLTDYEVKRSQMLSDLGYSVFAADLFGAGVRPTKVKDKRQHTGELYRDREKMRQLLYGAMNKAKEKGADIQRFSGYSVEDFHDEFVLPSRRPWLNKRYCLAEVRYRPVPGKALIGKRCCVLLKLNTRWVIQRHYDIDCPIDYPIHRIYVQDLQRVYLYPL